MKGIKLVRIDFRLIHGQVITKWSQKISANQIIVVNDELAADEFMADIYVMAAPPGIDVHMLTIDQFVQEVKNGNYESGNILVLFKNIQDIYKTHEKGVKFDAIQIGGLGGGSHKKSVLKGIYVHQEEMERLAEMQEAGTEITFQVIPEETKLSFDKAMKKMGV